MKTTKKPTAKYAEKRPLSAELNGSNKNYFETAYPFSIIRNEKTQGKTKLAFAGYVLTPNYADENEAKKAIENKDWDVMIDTFGIIQQLINKEEKQ